jgi:mycothiol synthase
VNVRPAVEGDAEAIAELCGALSADLDGSADVDAAIVRSWFAFPNVAMFAVDGEDGLRGYADVRLDDEGRMFPLDVRIHPAARGEGVAEALLAACEAWGQERAAADASFRGLVNELDGELGGALARSGYRPIRYSLAMEIELGESIEAPRWPDGISARTADPGRDEWRVYEAQEEAFADAWDYRSIPFDDWRRLQVERPRHDPDLWWLAEEGSELAGFSLNGWHYSGDPTHGFVAVLAVRRPWRRRGLALALLHRSFADFARRGATRVSLGVDAESPTGAVRLYERAGMRAVRRTVSYDKPVAG